MRRAARTPSPSRYRPRPDRDRIPVITTRFGGRTAEVPQAYYDFIQSDADTCCMAVDDLGPYSHSSVADGSWSNPAIWDAGTVPGEGSIVNIGHDVTYDVESDAKVKDINVEDGATLRWATDRDTRLWVDTLMSRGPLLIGEGSDPVPESSTPGKPRAEIVIHQTEAPGTSVRLGVVCKHAVRMVGAQKAPRLFSGSDIPVGSVAIKLDGLIGSNWRKGDRIVVGTTSNAGTSPTDPQYTGPTQFYGPYENAYAIRTRTLGYRLSHDELRTIVAIVGSTVVLDAPLIYDHVVTRGTLPSGKKKVRKPGVVNLSRSILIRSEDPSSLQTRGHTMFMHHDDADVRDVEFKDLGRTDTDPSLVEPNGIVARATNGGTVITNSNNVRGRYPVHLHWMGPYFGRRQAVIKGCSVWGENYPIPGWAITHHASRAAIEGCVVYNVRGAGIVSELGNEIGQWIGNTVLWCRGDGFPVSWGSRAELWQNHNGHAGVAYESQARQILQQGNIATSSNFGWLFMQQNVKQSTRVPDMYSLRLYDGLASGRGSGSSDPEFSMDEETYGIEQAQIPDFHDNVCYGVGDGFLVSHRQFTDRSDTTPMISRGFDCIATDKPFHLVNYSFYYSFYDFLWDGGAGMGSKGASLGEVAWQMCFVNGLVRNYSIGFAQDGLGFNYDGFWIDIDFENVSIEHQDFTGDFDLTAWNAVNPGKTWPEDSSFYNVMGPMIKDAANSTPTRWKGILRSWAPLNSATDLPQPYPALAHGPGGIEPTPGTPVPYMWMDPTNDVTLNTSGIISLKGTIVDRVGVRYYPDLMTSESFGPNSTYNGSRYVRANGNTPAVLVQRNGCFLDGSVWKTPVWLVDHDRLTGEYIQKRVDLALHSSTDAGLLAANVVDPAIPPTLPLRVEAIGLTASPIAA